MRTLKWVGGLVFLLILMCTAFIALSGWNWLREPVAHLVMEKTGRELVIGGDVQIDLGWPLVHIRTTDVRFGNPPWASQKDMLTAAGVELSLDVAELFDHRLVLDVLALRQANLFLESNFAGQKNWLLDLDQKDESARLLIGRMALEQSRITYNEPAKKTRIVAVVSTRETPAEGSTATEAVFSAQGQYRGLPLEVSGSGGPLLALRDERHPYPFRIAATIGRTRARAEGLVTGLSRLSAVDAKVGVRGDSLAQLFPLLGITLPKTPAYQSTGLVTHRLGTWRFEDFSARIGNSDLSGTLQVDTVGRGGQRPFLHGNLFIGKLALTDLGPVVGSRGGGAPSPGVPAERRRVLPDVAFDAEHWDSVDADVKLTARTIIRAKELPIDQLVTRLNLRDSALTLDPLAFAVAGGTLAGTITLDGQHPPIRAHVDLAAKKVVLGKLLPTLKPDQTNLGEVTGRVDLAGSGSSVAQMLATANGKVELLVTGGEMSKLMMEEAGLHVLEVIALKISGDQPIRIRCGVADFRVHSGVMHAEQLVFDTEISRVGGSGKIDFGQERLDLTLLPTSKESSLIALRSPIYVRGSFARPVVDVDKGRIAARGLGALALGVANPLLALAPLVELGLSTDSNCQRLIGETRSTVAMPVRKATP